MKELLTQLASTAPEMEEYISMYQYVLDNGSEHTNSEPLTKDERDYIWLIRLGLEMQPKQCFHNAQMLIFNDMDNRLTYHEGYVQANAPFPVLHAWVTLNGKMIDLTLDTNTYTTEQLEAFMFKGECLNRAEDLSDRVLGTVPDGWGYFGVPFSDSVSIRNRILRREETFSLIDDWKEGLPLLKKEQRNEV